MSTIEVFTPQEEVQSITVHETPTDRDNAKESHRYFKEAENPDLPEYVAEEKRSIARYLAKLAFEDRQKEYAGEKKPTSR